MALEYVEGCTLHAYLQRKGPPPVPVALGIMRQLAAALRCAAGLHLVHRDIKPENVLLAPRGEAKLADFGLCRDVAPGAPRRTHAGAILGTPLYMSPEQVEGKPADARSDLYSLGATCYHLLAGRPPFTGASAPEVGLHHLKTEPPALATIRPEVPPAL